MEGGIALPLESSSVAEVAVTCGSNDVAVAVEKSSSMAAGVLSMDLMEVQRQRILRELQVTINSYNDSFRSLSLLRADVEILRRENEALWGENFELSLLLQKQRSNLLAPTHEGCGILDPTSILPQIAGDENVPPGEGIITGNEKGEVVGVVPKSISIRSKGFLAVDQAPGRGGGITENASASGDITPRNFQPLPLGSVQVGETDGVGIEVEVFNQGVAKTELCNKWEEMGWCPYGDQCQFAHGVDELRPVIRHPRYKTQLCRMVSGPGGCPYGHRCHFRHAQHTPSSQ